jgi:hypothetical protein
MIVSILIGLTLILSTFISTVSIVQKMVYAQARMEPSNNGVTGKSIANGPQAAQGTHSVDLSKVISISSAAAGAGFAAGAVVKFKAHKDNPQQMHISQPCYLDPSFCP